MSELRAFVRPGADPASVAVTADPLANEVVAHAHTRSLLEATEAAYRRFVPDQLLGLMGVRSILDVKLGDQIERRMTLLFSDIRDFTTLSESMTPNENFRFINAYLTRMAPIIGRNRGIIDKYIGDAIMALFPNTADDALKCALEMLAELGPYNQGRQRAGYASVRIGMGLNTGIVMLGTVGGDSRMDTTVVSDAVNVAARLESATKIYRTPLLISEHTLYGLADQSRYHIRFVDRIRVKGRAQPQSVYEVFDHDPPAEREAKAATLGDFEAALAFYHMKQVPRAVPLLERCLAVAPDDHSAQIYLHRCREFAATGRHYGTGELDGTRVWTTDLASGVPTIDLQHRSLFDHFSALTRKVGGKDASDTREFLDFVSRYAVEHFAVEGELMKRYAYPMADEHRQQHRMFGKYFQRLQREIASGQHDPLLIAFHIQVFLIDWLVNHITKTDRHLTRFLRSIHAEETV
ncbi:MAG: bacteriohemerythrin [Deltaproteobacteria bacterium]|nr:bacteriohemerythrin [Deltaproteobacteria bacterium]